MRDILKDKSYRNYSYISRYSAFPYYYNVNDDKYLYGSTAQLSQDIPATLHKVAESDTYDSLSLKYYNTPIYFWIICDFNHIQDPLKMPAAGTYLKIPNLSTIKFDLTERV